MLVTRPTGSGQSTTLAAMIDEINRGRRGAHHDHRGPIEFLHEHRGSRSTSARSEQDTHGFRTALEHVLRRTRT